GDGTLDRLGLDLKAALRPQWHEHHARAAGANHGLIGDISRLGNDDLVALVEYTDRCTIKRALRPGHHHHLLRVGRLSALRLMSLCDCGPKTKIADHFAVMRTALAQGFDGCIDDGRRRVEVGIADAEQDDVLALPLEPSCTAVNFPGGGALASDAL